MKKRILIFALALVGLVSCTEETGPGAPGDITVRVFTGALQTKASTPGDGVVADGGGIAFDTPDQPDLKILIANASDDIVARYLGTGSNLQAGATATQMSVTFSDLTAGNYTVYAFANTSGLWSIAGGVDWTTVATGAAVEAMEFAPMAGPLAVQNGRLPMSAKGTLTVSSGGTGEISLQMIRCAAKITMDFVNNTGETLTLYDFSFALKGICPDRGYVLPISLPEVPSSTVNGNIENSETSKVEFASTGATKTKSYQFYVFPSVASGGRYLLDAGFKANSPSASPNAYSDLPVHDDHAVDITSLERNQHLHIVTRISKGLTVSFSFQVMDWTGKTENIIFH